MQPIDYFKLQAKNLLKDYKTQKPRSEMEPEFYDYSPTYYDVWGILIDFDLDDENFSLMNAQHVIAQLAGFYKWTDMLIASDDRLKLAKLLFDNQHKISADDWAMYIIGTERDNDVTFDDEQRLEIFEMVFANVDGHESSGQDYRLTKNEKPLNEKQMVKPKKIKTTVQIFALPLGKADSKEFIEVANSTFEEILQTIEPSHPKLIRKLWNPEQYIAKVLRADMLPIDRDYALSMIEAFLIHHVIGLAEETDKQAVHLN